MRGCNLNNIYYNKQQKTTSNIKNQVFERIKNGFIIDLLIFRNIFHYCFNVYFVSELQRTFQLYCFVCCCVINDFYISADKIRSIIIHTFLSEFYYNNKIKNHIYYSILFTIYCCSIVTGLTNQKQKILIRGRC